MNPSHLNMPRSSVIYFYLFKMLVGGRRELYLHVVERLLLWTTRLLNKKLRMPKTVAH